MANKRENRIPLCLAIGLQKVQICTTEGGYENKNYETRKFLF